RFLHRLRARAIGADAPAPAGPALARRVAAALRGGSGGVGGGAARHRGGRHHALRDLPAGIRVRRAAGAPTPARGGAEPGAGALRRGAARGLQASPPNFLMRLAMYLSTSFSNSDSTTGATTIFMRPGSG